MTRGSGPQNSGEKIILVITHFKTIWLLVLVLLSRRVSGKGEE